MIPISIPSRLWLSVVLIVIIAACATTTKPTIKLSATPISLEDGQELTLSADVQNTLKVEFFNGSKKIGEDSSAPYELKLPITSNEDATLVFTAKAIAADGQVALSEPVNVNVKVDKEAPKVSLVASSSNLNSAGAVTLTANATDNKGVVKVEFFKGAIKLGEDTTPADGFKYVVNLSAEDNGALKYIAKAFDAKGNAGTSAEVGVTVDIDVSGPNISLNANKTSVNSMGSVILTAEASDASGIEKVEFFKAKSAGEPEKIGEDTAAPYTANLSFTASDNGTHTYTAKAFDTRGNSTISSPVVITVAIDATNPTISLTINKTNLTQPGPVLLSASASDNNGVAKVEFYEETNKLAEDTQAPFTHELNFTFAQNGSHTYTAKAFDAQGNSATSDEVSVVVDIDATAPTVSLSASAASLSAPGSITFTATANDNKGVSKVELYRNGNKIGEDTTAADGFIFQQAYGADYKATDSFSAKAYDGDNNSGTSNTVEVAIYIDLTSPTVSLSASPSKLTQPGTLTLTAQSSDNLAVSKLEFYRVKTSGDELLKTSTNPAASVEHPLLLDGNDNGTIKFYAKAYDAKGNSTTTTQLAVEVEIKPSITKFEAAQGSSLTLSDAGGTVDLVWDGNHVQNYTLEVNPLVNIVIPVPGNTGNTSGRLTIPVNTTSSDKTYTVTLKAKSYGTPGFPDDVRTLNITVAKDTTVPTLSLSRDPTGDIIAGGLVTLTATASDAAGIQKVEFYQGTTLLSTDTDASDGYKHDLSFSATNNGNHSYFAKAYDTNGNTKDSDAVGVTVAIAPKISSLTSTSASLSDAGGSITLNWAAQSHQDFSLTLDNTTGVSGMPSGLTTNTSATIALPANLSNSAKTYTFTLTANPYGSVAADSKTLQVTVGADTTPPSSVTLTSDIATLKVAGTVKLTATATDAAGIQKVEFYKSGNPTALATDTTSPYEHTLSFSATDNGTHKYTAKVYDNNGNAASSSELSVVVNIVIWSKLVAGGQFSCGLSLDGKTYCWGANDQNQLGNLTYTNTTTPTAATTLSSFSLSQVQAGFSHACALTSLGKAYCWGRNNESELGNGHGNTSNPEVVMPGSVTFSQIGAGAWHSCALGSDSNVYCWGWNTYGQLGNGTDPKVTPTLISLQTGTFSKLAVGTYHTCALTSTGTAYCWGYNTSGQLSNNSLGHSATPIQVPGTYSQLVAGGEHTCGLTSGGQAYCWGYGGHGAIGDGFSSSRSTPTAVIMPSGVTFSQIVAGGSYHTCAFGSDSKVYCWGWNTSGQLGIGDFSNRTTPQAINIPSGVTFNQITAGGQHTCAVTSDNKAYCWGRNEFGQLGIGSNTNSSIPVLISQP